VARAPEAARGEALFLEVGCASCHLPSLTSGDASVAPLARQVVPLYSDLLLHDLGPKLADGIREGEAGAAEFRTSPLWVLRLRSSYLHDGRARTLRQAIVLHDGEAREVKRRFVTLREADREALFAFLASL
jgi:CxxC motif-containing protein (DUF1111 family)